MRFSPLLITNLLIWPLRYFFSHYAGDDNKYDSDPKITKIEIGAVNDFHKIPVQTKPRVIINRGNYEVRGVGLTDNLAEAETLATTKGLINRNNMVFINGMATIAIEARQDGTVELLADMVSHFIVWSRPYICNTQGFKNFGLPLGVTSATVGKEDKEIFTVTISVPYTMEEQWTVKNDGLKLNNFYTNLASS